MKNNSVEQLDQICKMKLRLIYFDCQWFQFTFKLIEPAFKIIPFFLPAEMMKHAYKVFRFLPQVKAEFINIQKLLEDQSLDYNDLIKIDDQLEQYLGKLYRQRLDLYFCFMSMLNIAENWLRNDNPFLGQMRKWLQEIDARMDKIIMAINRDEDISPPEKEEFENHLQARATLINRSWEPFQEQLSRYDQTACEEVEEIDHQYPGSLQFLRTIKTITSLLKGCNDAVSLDIEPQQLFFFLQQLLDDQYIVPALEHMVQMLTQYLNELVQTKKQELLETFGNTYSEVIRQLEIFLFLKSWQDKFAEQSSRLSLTSTEKKNLSDTLKVKQLLYTYKKQYWAAFFNKDPKNPFQQVQLVFVLDRFFDQSKQKGMTPRDLLVYFQREQRTLRQDIHNKEAELKTYGWKEHILSAIIRLWTGSFYYQWAEKSFLLSEDFIQNSALKDHPVLGVKLEGNSLEFFKNLESTTIIGIDLFASRWTGMSYAMLSSLSSFVIEDLNTIYRIGNAVNLDEKSIAVSLSKLQWLTGLGIHLGIYSSLLGFNVGSLGFFAGSYVAATLFREVAGYLTRYAIGANEESHSRVSQHILDMIEGVVKQFSYMVGALSWRYGYSRAHSFFSERSSEISAEELLNNSQFCLAQRNRCKEEVYNVLGLSPQASREELRKKWKRLVLDSHPDTAKDDSLDYMRIRKATDRLVELAEVDQTIPKFRNKVV